MLAGDPSQMQEGSLSLSGPAQYSLTLGSYLQGLSDSMTAAVGSSGTVTVDELNHGLVNISQADTSTEHPLHGHLLQMVLLAVLYVWVITAFSRGEVCVISKSYCLFICLIVCKKTQKFVDWCSW